MKSLEKENKSLYTAETKSRIMMMLEIPISLCVDRYPADIDATVRNAAYFKRFVQTMMHRAPKRSL